MRYSEIAFSVDYETMMRMENAITVMINIGWSHSKAERRVAFNYMNRLAFDNVNINERFNMLEKHR